MPAGNISDEIVCRKGNDLPKSEASRGIRRGTERLRDQKIIFVSGGAGRQVDRGFREVAPYFGAGRQITMVARNANPSPIHAPAELASISAD
jgi:hypothetical protein